MTYTGKTNKDLISELSDLTEKFTQDIYDLVSLVDTDFLADINSFRVKIDNKMMEIE